ncbi:hypothetical protein PInf_015377 [Phytophthora infestans]|nr:hypothetical protein PInf_015377 [Phytophthora infestans]
MQMDGSFIPPPFPFPEAWPRIFAEQQQRQERRWLTPTTFTPVQYSAPPTSEYFSPMDTPVSASWSGSRYHSAMNKAHYDDEAEGNNEEDDDEEYEYGYVLSDEWRERFQSSIQVQQLQQQKQKSSTKNKKKKPQQKKKPKQQTVNAEAVAAASASRSGHLQREIASAKTRELARTWKRRGLTAPLNPQVTALETSLNALFDEFCDTFQPVVWPHDPL